MSNKKLTALFYGASIVYLIYDFMNRAMASSLKTVLGLTHLPHQLTALLDYKHLFYSLSFGAAL